MIVRLMVPEDAANIAALEKCSFSDSWSEEAVREMEHSLLDTVFVAEKDGVCAGYGVVRIVAGEGELLRIAVLPAFRGRGYGKRLLEQALSFARAQGVSAMTLEVRRSNETARNLYESCGFAEEAVRKRYYHQPEEDAILMWNRRI